MPYTKKGRINRRLKLGEGIRNEKAKKKKTWLRQGKSLRGKKKKNLPEKNLRGRG